MIFQDRRDAGRQLVEPLLAFAKKPETVVVGLPRGGVVTAFEIAQGLNLPLSVLVVRKIGAPGNEELAIGALSETGEAFFNDEMIKLTGASPEHLKKTIEKEKRVAEERSMLYLGKKKQIDFQGKTVILVDDGIATGATIEVAIRSLRKAKVKKIVLAVPVAAPDSLKRLKKLVDETVCLSTPSTFYAVASFYQNFSQTSDKEVIDLLARANR